MAEWYVRAAAGRLQAMKDADAEHAAVLMRSVPPDITMDGAAERSREMARTSEFAIKARGRFWRHCLDKVAPLLGYGAKYVETLRREVLKDPQVAEELEG